MRRFVAVSMPACLASGLLAGIVALAAPVHPQSATPPGAWMPKAPMPALRGEVAATVVGGKLYALGGTVNRQAVARNEEYDPATDRWRERAPLPQPRDHLGVAVVNGKIYTFGGFTSSVHQGSGDVVFEYDPAADVWRTLAPMKAGRASVGVAVVGGKIHVVGGRTLPTAPGTTHEVFDPASGQWREAAPLPRARDHMATVAVDGKIHVIGGRLGGNADHVAQHGSAGPPLPTSRSGVAGIFYRGLVVVLGGELPPGHTFVENEGYDPKTGRWVTLAPMPAGRHGSGAGVVGQDLYVVGGSLTPGGPGNTDQLIMFRLP
jgi:hypothetical protein